MKREISLALNKYMPFIICILFFALRVEASHEERLKSRDLPVKIMSGEVRSIGVIGRALAGSFRAHLPKRKKSKRRGAIGREVPFHQQQDGALVVHRSGQRGLLPNSAPLESPPRPRFLGAFDIPFEMPRPGVGVPVPAPIVMRKPVQPHMVTDSETPGAGVCTAANLAGKQSLRRPGRSSLTIPALYQGETETCFAHSGLHLLLQKIISARPELESSLQYLREFKRADYVGHPQASLHHYLISLGLREKHLKGEGGKTYDWLAKALLHKEKIIAFLQSLKENGGRHHACVPMNPTEDVYRELLTTVEDSLAVRAREEKEITNQCVKNVNQLRGQNIIDEIKKCLWDGGFCSLGFESKKLGGPHAVSIVDMVEVKDRNGSTAHCISYVDSNDPGSIIINELSSLTNHSKENSITWLQDCERGAPMISMEYAPLEAGDNQAHPGSLFHYMFFDEDEPEFREPLFREIVDQMAKVPGKISQYFYRQKISLNRKSGLFNEHNMAVDLILEGTPLQVSLLLDHSTLDDMRTELLRESISERKNSNYAISTFLTQASDENAFVFLDKMHEKSWLRDLFIRDKSKWMRDKHQVQECSAHLLVNKKHIEKLKKLVSLLSADDLIADCITYKEQKHSLLEQIKTSPLLSSRHKQEIFGSLKKRGAEFEAALKIVKGVQFAKKDEVHNITPRGESGLLFH